MDLAIVAEIKSQNIPNKKILLTSLVNPRWFLAQKVTRNL